MHGAIVVSLDPAECRGEVVAVSALVAHRPGEHARTVFISADIAFLAVDYRLTELRIVGDFVVVGVLEAGETRYHAVRLEVAFVHNVEAVLVGEFVEHRAVRIVRSADSVHVEFFHQREVLDYVLDRHRGARSRVEVMTVHAHEFYGLVVEKVHAVLDFGRADTHFFADKLAAVFDKHIVKVRIFRAPKTRVFYFERSRFALPDRLFLAEESNRSGLAVKERERNRAVERGSDLIVNDVTLGASENIRVAENTGEAQFVLILEVRAHAPFQHEHVDLVVAAFDKIGRVELGLTVRDLREADELVVYIKIKARVHALEIDVVTLAFFLGDLYESLIMIGRVDIRHVRRIVRERIVHVRVLKMIVTVVLHARRHFDFRRGRSLIKVVRHGQGAVVLLYRPLAVEVDETVAFLSATERVLGFSERNVVATRVQSVHCSRLLVVLFKHLFSPFELVRRVRAERSLAVSYHYYTTIPEKSKYRAANFGNTKLPSYKRNFVQKTDEPQSTARPSVVVLYRLPLVRGKVQFHEFDKFVGAARRKQFYADFFAAAHAAEVRREVLADIDERISVAVSAVTERDMP